MSEFDLIDRIVNGLGTSVSGPNVVAGTGDDCSVMQLSADHQMVSSVDTMVEDVHFPAKADAALIGYRGVMGSCSDLAAMGANPSHILVALCMPKNDSRWAERLAIGIGGAAKELGIVVAGGNVSRGPLSITYSVHGEVPNGKALLRRGAQPGDRVYVSGALGAAASAVKYGELIACGWDQELDALASAYFKPQARIELGIALRGIATSAIDVSDGLLQDLGHLCRASGVGASLHSDRIPINQEAGLQEALLGGDDYELIFTSTRKLSQLPVAVTDIGEITAGDKLKLDGQETQGDGYQHF